MQYTLEQRGGARCLLADANEWFGDTQAGSIRLCAQRATIPLGLAQEARSTIHYRVHPFDCKECYREWDDESDEAE
jgi:hypothetical protein